MPAWAGGNVLSCWNYYGPEEDFRSGKGCFGLDESQVRLFTAIIRHTMLVMAALAICAVTAALLRRRTDTRAPAPVRPDQPPPADPGMIPLTVPETGLLASAQQNVKHAGTACCPTEGAHR